jgi:enoyl-[acyl-carrier-protein] reductase (NADH)
MGNLLSGKNILIMGVRNKWSIAWGIAKAAFDEGANLIFTNQDDKKDTTNLPNRQTRMKYNRLNLSLAADLYRAVLPSHIKPYGGKIDPDRQ